MLGFFLSSLSFNTFISVWTKLYSIPNLLSLFCPKLHSLAFIFCRKNSIAASVCVNTLLSPATGSNWTHYLSVTRCVIYHCATTAGWTKLKVHRKGKWKVTMLNETVSNTVNNLLTCSKLGLSLIKDHRKISLTKISSRSLKLKPQRHLIKSLNLSLVGRFAEKTYSAKSMILHFGND